MRQTGTFCVEGFAWAGFRTIFRPKNLICLNTTAIKLNFLDSY